MDTYAAGLIDGEGYIGISHVKRANVYNIRIQVAMVTKGTAVLTRMHRQYGGRMTTRPPESEQNAPKDAWVLDGQEAYDLLVSIRPHLILKADQADCAMQLWEAILSSRKARGRTHWTDALRKRAHVLMLRIQEGNRRGPDPSLPSLPPGRPVAIYRWGEWWEPEPDLFGPVEFTDRLPTSGVMVRGHVYQAPGSDPSSSPGLLPTPNASDTSKHSGQPPEKRKARGHSTRLTDAVEYGLPR